MSWRSQRARDDSNDTPYAVEQRGRPSGFPLAWDQESDRREEGGGGDSREESIWDSFSCQQLLHPFSVISSILSDARAPLSSSPDARAKVAVGAAVTLHSLQRNCGIEWHSCPAFAASFAELLDATGTVCVRSHTLCTLLTPSSLVTVVMRV